MIDGRVRFSEIDHTRKITVPSIINYFQDCSTFQSEDIGVGLDVLSKKKKAWIEKRFGGIKSKITSNGILCAEKRRLFYMGGFLAYPENYDNRGGYIYEFDYDTGCALNEYSLRYYFFRAYELRMNMQDLSKAMDLYEEPCVGWLQPFERCE